MDPLPDLVAQQIILFTPELEDENDEVLLQNFTLK